VRALSLDASRPNAVPESKKRSPCVEQQRETQDRAMQRLPRISKNRLERAKGMNRA